MKGEGARWSGTRFTHHASLPSILDPRSVLPLHDLDLPRQRLVDGAAGGDFAQAAALDVLPEAVSTPYRDRRHGRFPHSERGPGRRDLQVADANVGGLLPAPEEDLGELLGAHEVRVAQGFAVLLERNAHALVDVGPH